MGIDDYGSLTVVINLVYAVLFIALLLAFARLLRGPSLPDRVVALDLIGALVVSFLCTHAIATGQRELLDVAIVLALIAFLSTVAFAQYIQRGANDR
jgi:multicomponent Na+:H+ antiporter subunit F